MMRRRFLKKISWSLLSILLYSLLLIWGEGDNILLEKLLSLEQSWTDSKASSHAPSTEFYGSFHGSCLPLCSLPSMQTKMALVLPQEGQGTPGTAGCLENPIKMSVLLDGCGAHL